MTITLQYDDRLCGRGKTTDLWKRVNKSKEQFLVVSPTVELNKQQAEGIENCRRIDSDTTSGTERVRKELLEAMHDGKQRNILATHRALPVLIRSMNEDAFSSLGHYHLVLDEAFSDCTNEVSYNFGHEMATLLVKDWTYIEQTPKWPDVLEVSGSLNPRLQQLAEETTGCSVLGDADQLRRMATRILDPLYRTFIHRRGYEALKGAVEDSRTAAFTLVSFLCPTAFAKFKSVTCLSAFFRETEYALVSEALGVQFSNISPPEAPTTYANSARLHIHHFTEHKWTTGRRQLLDEQGRSNIDKVQAFIKEDVGENPIIYNAHKEDRKQLEAWKSGELVTETHGRNDLRHHTKAAFLGSRNASPQLALLLRAMKVSRHQIDSARTLLAGFQLFMRTNLREEADNQIVDIYCADMLMVNFMLRVFPDAIIQRHEIQLQDKVLEDRRQFNEGGAREGAGRKPEYPRHFSESDKRSYRRHLEGTENPMSRDDWLNDKQRVSHLKKDMY